MSKNNRSHQSHKETTPRGPRFTEAVTIPLGDYEHLLRVCSAFDTIINSVDRYGVNKDTVIAVCKSLGIDFSEGEDA